MSKRGFVSGHDQKLRIALENKVGGLEALRELVEGHCRALQIAATKEPK